MIVPPHGPSGNGGSTRRTREVELFCDKEVTCEISKNEMMIRKCCMLFVTKGVVSILLTGVGCSSTLGDLKSSALWILRCAIAQKIVKAAGDCDTQD